MPKAAGKRAECTASGVRTLPNCLRLNASTSDMMGFGGFSSGGRNVPTVVFMPMQTGEVGVS